jgi:hypothetical protein
MARAFDPALCRAVTRDFPQVRIQSHSRARDFIARIRVVASLSPPSRARAPSDDHPRAIAARVGGVRETSSATVTGAEYSRRRSRRSGARCARCALGYMIGGKKHASLRIDARARGRSRDDAGAGWIASMGFERGCG